MRIIDKTGPLANPADRDHCIQYMVAVPLIFGRLTADDYEDDDRRDPRIDALRAKMQVGENPHFTKDYFDPDKRYIGNAVQVFFKDGTHTERSASTSRSATASAAPRDAGAGAKFDSSVDAHFSAKQAERIKALFGKSASVDAMPVNEFVAAFVTNGPGGLKRKTRPRGRVLLNGKAAAGAAPLFLADLDRHEQARIAALDEQCHVALGLLHGRAQLVGGGDRSPVGRQHYISGLDARICRRPAYPLDDDATGQVPLTLLLGVSGRTESPSLPPCSWVVTVRRRALVIERARSPGCRARHGCARSRG